MNLIILSWIIVILKLVALYFTLGVVLPQQIREYRAKKDEVTPLRKLLIGFNLAFSLGVFLNFILVLAYVTGLLSPEFIGFILPFEFLLHSIITLIAALFFKTMYTTKVGVG